MIGTWLNGPNEFGQDWIKVKLNFYLGISANRRRHDGAHRAGWVLANGCRPSRRTSRCRWRSTRSKTTPSSIRTHDREVWRSGAKGRYKTAPLIRSPR